jgi:hypothetical protein
MEVFAKDREISIKSVIKDGTGYFLNNLGLLLVFYLPVFALVLWVYFSNIIANPFRLFKLLDIPYFTYIAMLACFLMLGYYCFAIAYFSLRVASRDSSFPALQQSPGMEPVTENITALALKRVPGLVILELIIMTAGIIGTFFFIIPGIIIVFTFIFTSYIYALNGGVFMSLQESRDLMKKNYGYLFSLLLLIFIVNIGLSIIFSFIKSPLDGVWYFLPDLLNNIIGLFAGFWLFALYKHALLSKSFVHAADRQGHRFSYKFMAWLCGLIGVIFIAGVVWVMSYVGPRFMSLAQLEVKSQGQRTILYYQGVPIAGAEATGFQKSKWYYFEKGKLKMEWESNMLIMNGESKTYYEDGRLYKLQNYRNNNLDGEETIYDEDGKVIEQHYYEKGKIVHTT